MTTTVHAMTSAPTKEAIRSWIAVHFHSHTMKGVHMFSTPATPARDLVLDVRRLVRAAGVWKQQQADDPTAPYGVSRTRCRMILLRYSEDSVICIGHTSAWHRYRFIAVGALANLTADRPRQVMITSQGFADHAGLLAEPSARSG